MKARSFIVLLVLFLGCSIIEDTDIQTQEQLDQLTFSGFQIDQTRSGSTAIVATLIEDEEVNQLDTAYNKYVKRVKTFTAPEMSGKMKYRSGATGSNLTFQTTYLENDVPYTWRVFQGDSLVEMYRFRYDENDSLFRIITVINPIDNLPPTVVTFDHINYTDQKISSIDRESEVAGLAGTFSNFLLNYNGDQPPTISTFSFQNINVDGYPGNCSNGNYNCRAYNTHYTGTSGFVPGISVGIRAVSTLGATAKVIVEDGGNGNSGGECCREPDDYYFHPLMVWQGSIQNGHLLLPIYLVDWVKPGEQLSNGGNQSSISESITIQYLYDR